MYDKIKKLSTSTKTTGGSSTGDSYGKYESSSYLYDVRKSTPRPPDLTYQKQTERKKKESVLLARLTSNKSVFITVLQGTVKYSVLAVLYSLYFVCFFLPSKLIVRPLKALFNVIQHWLRKVRSKMDSFMRRVSSIKLPKLTLEFKGLIAFKERVMYKMTLLRNQIISPFKRALNWLQTQLQKSVSKIKSGFKNVYERLSAFSERLYQLIRTKILSFKFYLNIVNRTQQCSLRVVRALISFIASCMRVISEQGISAYTRLNTYIKGWQWRDLKSDTLMQWKAKCLRFLNACTAKIAKVRLKKPQWSNPLKKIQWKVNIRFPKLQFRLQALQTFSQWIEKRLDTLHAKGVRFFQKLPSIKVPHFFSKMKANVKEFFSSSLTKINHNLKSLSEKVRLWSTVLIKYTRQLIHEVVLDIKKKF